MSWKDKQGTLIQQYSLYTSMKLSNENDENLEEI